VSFIQLITTLIEHTRVPAWALAVLLVVAALPVVARIICMIICVRAAVSGDDEKSRERALKIVQWLVTRRGRPRKPSPLDPGDGAT